MIGLGLGVWLRSEQLGEGDTVVPERSVTVSQTLADFSQEITAETIGLTLLDVTQTLEDFSQTVTVLAVEESDESFYFQPGFFNSAYFGAMTLNA